MKVNCTWYNALCVKALSLASRKYQVQETTAPGGFPNNYSLGQAKTVAHDP